MTLGRLSPKVCRAERKTATPRRQRRPSAADPSPGGRRSISSCPSNDSWHDASAAPSPPPSLPPSPVRTRSSSRPSSVSSDAAGNDGRPSALAPDEADDFAELRALLPMFRDMRREHTVANELAPWAASHQAKTDLVAKADSSTHSDTSDDSTDDGGEGGYVKLSRDVYSLMYFTIPFSVAFFFAIGTFVFQISILGLIMADIVDPESSNNPLNIPAGVGRVVRVSQFLAILIAVATQDDMISSINIMHTGYNEDVLKDKNHGGARWQWTLSVACCFIEGALCLSVTFILIMQSADVIGLFLDFLAVTFVSELDDIAFALGVDGYFSKRLQIETLEVLKVRVPKSNTASHWFRPLVFVLVSAGMLTGWGYITTGQMKGRYLSCQKIAVQFGDEFRATLGFFSSIYEVHEFDQKGRPIYIEQGPALDGAHYGRAMFAYCEYENAWTFSFPDPAGAPVEACHWYAKSAETFSYDIMTISPSDWFAYGKESKGAVPFQHFSLLCLDCNFESERGSCSSVGVCMDNFCECYDGRYGLNCEFEEPCLSIEVDTLTGGFPGPVDWSHKYDILFHRDGVTKAKVYERPVYTGEYANGTFHVIMFTGRRWIVSTSRNLMNTSNPVASWELADFLTNSFHAHWTKFDAVFISSPADVVTPTDAATPVGLDWYRMKSYDKGADKNFAVSTKLLCGICDDRNNPCSNDGACVNEACICPYGTFGALCQVKDFVLCQSIEVQFGDELVSSIGAFSGVYDLSSHTISGRAVYVARQLRHAMFAYCEESTAWAFISLPPGKSFLMDEPCSEWKAMSRISETYDITSLETGWIVRRNKNADSGVPFEHFLLSCVDCGRSRKKRPCSGSGKCEDNRCICDSGKYGLACQLYEPCQELDLDSSRQIQQPAHYDILRYHDGKYVKVYERPVYVSAESNQTFSIVVFIGSRWVITNSETHAFLNNTLTSNDLADYFTHSFHGYFSNFVVEFISEPVYINTILDTPSPVDLKWYEPKTFDNKRPDLAKPLATVPQCTFCNHLDYPCFNKGSCANGKCICASGTYGAHCQIDYVCTNLSVHFGDQVRDPLPSRSGIYVLRAGPNNTFSGRPIYVAQDRKGMFAYCSEEMAWTFTHWENQDSVDIQEPCGGWTAKSSSTYSYDLLTVSKWYTWKNATHFVALLPASFSYACNEEW